MDDPVDEFGGVRELRRNWWIPGWGLFGLLMGLLLLELDGWSFFGLLLTWICGWLVPLTLVRNAFPNAEPVPVRATRTRLTVDEAEIPVEEILESRVLSRAGPDKTDIVDLRLKKRHLRLALPAKDAARLISLLGAGAGERRATFTLVMPFASRFWGALGVVGLPMFAFSVAIVSPLGAIMIALPFFILPVCVTIAWLLGFLRGKLVIGADGFTTRWFGRGRFRRFEEVESIELREKSRGMVVDTYVRFLEANGGGFVRFVAHDAPDSHAQHGAESRALAATMEEAYARWTRLPDVAKASQQLERGTRSAKEWLASIDHVARGGQGNYRVAAVTPDVLVDVARSADGKPDARVGAAAALLRLKDKAHRPMIRIAAEACAEPTTRQALLELVEADDDEERLEAALAKVRHHS